ncbi:ABC transporter ATP-binding protein [Liberiplasma polymorphum]|uniref:ABC transporter ATP-binding protein n=1 Tax=Liberiplasma polymorphum TaxID=3374570 RepID=UPI003771A613
MKIIDVKNVSKNFGKIQALKEVNLTVNQGNIYGFIGPNGAGKTTLIRVLLGILKADKGQAEMFGQDVWHEAVNIHKSIAYVPGDVKLWPNLTGGEVIDILISMRNNQKSDKKDTLIKKFDLDTSKKCRSYSKGNRQKVALIAALASHAEVFILDEPTSGLDPLMERVFQEEIFELKKQGKTVFLSSHILSEIEKLCDYVSIIRDGEIIESGKLEDLRHLTRTAITLKSEDTIKDLEHVKGIHEYNVENGVYTFQVETKSLDALIKHLGQYTITKFESNPPTLEDLFMRHYQGV